MQVVMMSDPQIETWKDEAMEAWKSVQVLNLLALLVKKYNSRGYRPMLRGILCGGDHREER